MLQAGGHEGAVPVVQLTALRRGCRAIRPAPREGALGIAPADEILQALQIKRMTHVTAQRAPLLVHAEDSRYRPLPFTTGSLQGDDVVGLEVAVLAIEQPRELIQCGALIRDELAQLLAALRLDP